MDVCLERFWRALEGPHMESAMVNVRQESEVDFPVVLWVQTKSCR